MIHKIVLFGDPVLREAATEPLQVDEALKAFAQDMIETMHEAEGIGLAAQQVGVAKALCVVDVPEDHDVDEEGGRLNPDLPMPFILLNPEISDPSEDADSYQEGCLSFPDIHGQVVRPYEVTVTWMGLDGQAHEARVRGLLGRCIQHEVDHLNGILFIDHMSHVKRVAIRGKLKRLKQGL